jgi:hypothetical protein
MCCEHSEARRQLEEELRRAFEATRNTPPDFNAWVRRMRGELPPALVDRVTSEAARMAPAPMVFGGTITPSPVPASGGILATAG